MLDGFDREWVTRNRSASSTTSRDISLVSVLFVLL
jgi:hypothetical protein